MLFELAEDKWGWVLEATDEQLRRDESDDVELNDTEDGLEEEAWEDDAAEFTGEKNHPLKKFYGQFEGFMSQVPVLGLNSAKYDLNLIKRSIARHLNMHDEEQKGTFIFKKCNAYACIASDQFKFLDMSQFLAAGSLYAGFLKAFNVEEAKSFFCYDWFTSIEELHYSSLPDHKDFYIALKGCNISAEDYQFCQKVWADTR